MTFGAPSGSSGNGAKGNGSGSNGKVNAVTAGPNGKNKELAARQQKGAAQTTARKRRILGVRIRIRIRVFLLHLVFALMVLLFKTSLLCLLAFVAVGGQGQSLGAT